MAHFEPCKLDATQEKLWDKTRCALLWHCPAFTHIFYEMLNNADSKHIALFTKDIPIAATDGSNLLLNPDTFFKYDLNEQVFAVAHEIMHCVLDHCSAMWLNKTRGKVRYPDGSSLDYDQEVANVAMDLVINDLLIDSKVGQFNKNWLHDKKFGTMDDAWIDVYKKVFKAKKSGQPGPNGMGFDQHLQPGTSIGKDPATAVSQRSAVAWGNAIAAASASAKAQGKLPGALERMFGAALEPQVDWKERIRALFMRRVGSDAYDWKKPDRRYISRTPDPIYVPGRSGFGCGTVVVAVDTSGSVDDKSLDMFMAEMYGILDDVGPRELYIMWCDAYVHRVDICDEPSDITILRSERAPGRGGTSFIPPFEKVEELGLEPDALVYLTDGIGPFPGRAPSYPVVWGNIHPASKYPFGDVVDIPKQV